MNKNFVVLSMVFYGVFVIVIVVGIVEFIFMVLDFNFMVGNDFKLLVGKIF